MPIPSFVCRSRLVLASTAVLAVLACGENSAPDADVVAPPSPTAGLTVAPASAMLRIGDTLRFALPRGACDLTQARWQAGNPSVLSVDPVLGLATAREVGSSSVRLLQPGCRLTIAPSAVSVIP
ncbi:MAG: hypothetical protein ABI877_08285 [Gemmatimonadaceae bacterium]